MSCLDEVECLDKKLKNLSAISESHKVTKHLMEWRILESDIKKNIATVGGYIESDWIYKEDTKYYYLMFYPNGQDDSTKGQTLIKIVFYEEIPENAYVQGNMSIRGEELNVAKEFEVKSFTKQSVIEFIDTQIGYDNIDLIIHCSLTHNIHQVECESDGKKASCKQIKTPVNIFNNLSELSDCTFFLRNGERCDASKALLVKVPYFRKLFDENDNKDSFDLTEMDIRKHAFDQFLYYLYNNNNLPLLDFKLAYELYALAQYFEFFELKNLCSTYLTANLTVKNVIIVLKISHMWHDLILKKECFQFIKVSDPDTLARESIL